MLILTGCLRGSEHCWNHQECVRLTSMSLPESLTPLGPENSVELFDCLQQSLSQDSLVQKSAEAALEQFERRPNFCACLAVSMTNKATFGFSLCTLRCSTSVCNVSLQEILKSKQADHSVRWLAAVQFKNTIAKRWRPRGGPRYCTFINFALASRLSHMYRFTKCMSLQQSARS